MPAAEHRRNGKPASCETCRKAKVRCDHQRPVCGRCRRRGISAQCFYHPAPLTKPWPPDFGAETQPQQASLQPSQLSTLPADHTTTASSAVPTARLERTSDPISLPWSSISPRRHEGTSSPPSSRSVLSADSIQSLKDILLQFQHFSFMKRLLDEYGVHGQAAMVPKPFIDYFISCLPVQVSLCFDGADGTNERHISEVVHSVIENTSKSIEITSETTFEGFVSMFSGENLRLETIGLLHCLAARSCCLGLARDDKDHDDFIQGMYRSTSTCLYFSKRLAPATNDGTIWLAFEYLRLATQIEGEASPLIYRLVGDVSTHIYDFGLQRESSITRNTPFFLAECRRKAFTASFQFDKFVSALADRPPRLPKRFSDCRMPLDLDDEELLASQTEEQARLNLTPDGWNPKARYIPATWHRLRYILGTLREEIMQYSYREPSAETEALLMALSQQCKHQKESLPLHVRYRKEYWDSDLPASCCLMLTIIHLSFLELDFEIHRLLEKCNPGYWQTSMDFALDIVSVILHLGTYLNRATFLRYDFPYIVLGFGLTCIAVLASILQSTSTPSGITLPPTTKRATLVRTLSVYVSHLDSMCKPGDGEYNRCLQASKVISRVLDEALDPPTLPMVEPSQVIHTDGTQQSSDLQPVWEESDLGTLDGMGEFDLSSWVKNIDWTGNGSEWSTI